MSILTLCTSSLFGSSWLTGRHTQTFLERGSCGIQEAMKKLSKAWHMNALHFTSESFHPRGLIPVCLLGYLVSHIHIYCSTSQLILYKQGSGYVVYKVFYWNVFVRLLWYVSDTWLVRFLTWFLTCSLCCCCYWIKVSSFPSWFFSIFPWHETLNHFYSHNGLEVARSVDGLDGVARQPFAWQMALGVPQAAACCKDSMINIFILMLDTKFKHNSCFF